MKIDIAQSSIVLLVLASMHLSFGQQQYRYENVEAPDNVAIAGVHSIVQDSVRFLWAHYPGGLARYNGYSYKLYPYNPKDSLHSPGSVLDGRILLDPSGNVWTKSNQAHSPDNTLELSKYNSDIDGFVKYRHDVGESFVYSVCLDKNDPIVWLGTFPGKGLYAFDTKTGETKRFVNHLSEQIDDFTRGSATEQRNVIFGISDRGSSLLLATWKGLWRFDKRTKTFSRPPNDVKDTLFCFTIIPSFIFTMITIGIIGAPSEYLARMQ